MIIRHAHSFLPLSSLHFLCFSFLTPLSLLTLHFFSFPLLSSLLFVPLSVASFSDAVVPLEMVEHVVVTRCTQGNGRGDKCEGWAYDVIGEEEELRGIGEIEWCSGC